MSAFKHFVTKSYTGLFLLLMNFQLLAADPEMPTTPVGTAEAESGDMLSFLFLVGIWVIKGLMYLLTAAAVLIVIAGAIKVIMPWINGKIDFAEVAGKVVGITVLLLFVIVMVIWGLGWISGLTLE